MGWRERNRPPNYMCRRRIYDRYLKKRVWIEYGWWLGWKRKSGRYYRTYNYHRFAMQFDPEYSRPKRSPRRLPEHYDDTAIKYQRSWKSHRREQYKPKEIS